MRALVPIGVLAVVVVLMAALADVGAFGGTARQAVGMGPPTTEVVITFTPAEMTAEARAAAATSTTLSAQGGESPPSTQSSTSTSEGGTSTTNTPHVTSSATHAPTKTTRRTARATATSRTTVRVPATYVVRPGDTPASIAEKLGVSTAALMRLNGIANPTNLLVGAVLEVPSP